MNSERPKGPCVIPVTQSQQPQGQDFKMKDDAVVPMLGDSSDTEPMAPDGVCRRCRGSGKSHYTSLEIFQRLARPWFLLGCGVIIFTFFCIVVALSIYLVSNLAKYPGLLITGSLQGNVSTNLGGALGNITLYPFADINLKVSI